MINPEAVEKQYHLGERPRLGPNNISLVRDFSQDPVQKDAIAQAEIFLREVVAEKRSPRNEPEALKDPVMEAFLMEAREEFGGRSILAAIRYVIEEEKRVPILPVRASRPSGPRRARRIVEVEEGISLDAITVDLPEEDVSVVKVSRPRPQVAVSFAEPEVKPKLPSFIVDASILLSKTPFALPITRNFLLAVIAEGGTLIPTDLREKEKETRVREQNIIFAYFGTPATLELVGHVYRNKLTRQPLTRPRVTQIINRGMLRFWENSSAAVKEKFPLETIPMGKPRSPKMKGRDLEIMRHIQEGQSYQQLIESGISAGEITRLRARLKKNGYEGELPYPPLQGDELKKFNDSLESTDSPEKIRGLLDQLKPLGVGIFRSIDRGRFPLTRLVDILLVADYRHSHRGMHLVVKALESNGVVVGLGEEQSKSDSKRWHTKRYYFIRIKDLEKAVEIIGTINPDESGEDNSPRFDELAVRIRNHAGEIGVILGEKVIDGEVDVFVDVGGVQSHIRKSIFGTRYQLV